LYGRRLLVAHSSSAEKLLVQLLIHDTLMTSPFTIPLKSDWTMPALPVEARTRLTASDIGPNDVALLPAGEIALLHESHRVVPDFAAVSDQRGAISMRVPVRPDEIRITPVRLWNATSTAELLARATLHPFYGITPGEFTSTDSAQAQVVVLEGAEALQPPEAGFAEDLVRAWFVLTAQSFVSHILVAPLQFDRNALQPVLQTLTELRTTGHERRKDVRRYVAESTGLDPNLVTEFSLAQRFELNQDDRRSLLMLLQRGNRGSAYPYVWDVTYLE
jgi:predicted solute-binding protein